MTHRWDSWRVRHAGVEARQRSHRYSYEYLPADRFYELAMGAMRDAGQTLSMGIDVKSVRRAGEGCKVETNRGALRSRWVFDSRPRPRGEVRPMLEQRFAGWHVRTERPCFDASMVDLMDFQPSMEQGRTAFFYVLPFSATEALVEATFLDDPALAPADAEAVLRRHMEQLSGGAYEVLYREAARLPMGEEATREPSRGHIVEIGTRGGRVKASSGYAFLRIQRQSAALADALAKGVDLPKRFEPLSYSVLDSIFLRALKRFPGRAPGYFLALFRQLPPETLVRFLSETASPAEVLRVMLALPKFDFAQAALLPEVGRSL